MFVKTESYHILLNNVVTNCRLGYIRKEGAYQEIEYIENKFIDESEPDGDLAYAIADAIEKINNC